MPFTGTTDAALRLSHCGHSYAMQHFMIENYGSADESDITIATRKGFLQNALAKAHRLRRSAIATNKQADD